MNKVRVFMTSVLVMFMALSFSSCEEEIRYGSVVGCWELESDEYGYVDDVMVDKYPLLCRRHRGVWLLRP